MSRYLTTEQKEMKQLAKPWNQSDAIALCVAVEAVCPPCGCHVALTGGLLYKVGARKDCDLLFYRIRQVEKIDMDSLWPTLSSIGIIKNSGFGWCYKATYSGKPIDIFFPEEQGGEYSSEEARQAALEARADAALDRAGL